MRIFVAATSIALAVAWQAARSTQEDDLNLKYLTKTEVSSVSRSDQSWIKIPVNVAAFLLGPRFAKF